MWTIIIVIIITVSVILWNERSDFDDPDYIIFISFVGILVGLLLGAMVAIIIPSKTKEVVEIYYLETLQDNNSVKGSFFLGSGNINGEMKYVFYYDVDGGYKMNQISYDNTLIKYTEDSPKVEHYKLVKTDAFINHFTIYLGCSCKDRNVIYIPKESVKTDYVLDAK